MKIVFVGSGTGGHFYPLIAVAEEVRRIARERRLVSPKLYHLAPNAYDMEALFENEIAFISCPAGKWRRYFSLQNYLDLFVTLSGFFSAFTTLFHLNPDVVFSKGGFASVPVVLAARLLGVPVVIHESDVHPGRANLLAALFAYRIAVTFDETTSHFPANVRGKIARTGVPIRSALHHPVQEGAADELALDQTVPTLLILGGSSGARTINEVVLSALPELVPFVNIIHQTGRDHYASVERTAKVILAGNGEAHRYHPFPYLNTLSMRRAAGAAQLIVSRAGMTAVAEIALWAKPALLVPIPESVSHDQRTNAYAYAKTGAAIVLEEQNLTPHVLASEVRRILADSALQTRMSEASGSFANAQAGAVIAEELISIGLSHEPETPTPEA